MSPIISNVFSTNFIGTPTGRKIELTINEAYSEYEQFYIEYTTADGCIYRGEIGPIIECQTGELEGIRFEIQYIGNDLQACELGQQNEYVITIDEDQLGENYPYRIYVRMVEATYPEESDYRRTILIEDNFDNPITIDDIPSGVVSFFGYDACGALEGYQCVFRSTCASHSGLIVPL